MDGYKLLFEAYNYNDVRKNMAKDVHLIEELRKNKEYIELSEKNFLSILNNMDITKPFEAACRLMCFYLSQINIITKTLGVSPWPSNTMDNGSIWAYINKFYTLRKVKNFIPIPLAILKIQEQKPEEMLIFSAENYDDVRIKLEYNKHYLLQIIAQGTWKNKIIFFNSLDKNKPYTAACTLMSYYFVLGKKSPVFEDFKPQIILYNGPITDEMIWEFIDFFYKNIGQTNFIKKPENFQDLEKLNLENSTEEHEEKERPDFLNLNPEEKEESTIDFSERPYYNFTESPLIMNNKKSPKRSRKKSPKRKSIKKKSIKKKSPKKKSKKSRKKSSSGSKSKSKSKSKSNSISKSPISRKSKSKSNSISRSPNKFTDLANISPNRFSPDINSLLQISPVKMLNKNSPGNNLDFIPEKIPELFPELNDDQDFLNF